MYIILQIFDVPESFFSCAKKICYYKVEASSTLEILCKKETVSCQMLFKITSIFTIPYAYISDRKSVVEEITGKFSCFFKESLKHLLLKKQAII